MAPGGISDPHRNVIGELGTMTPRIVMLTALILAGALTACTGSDERSTPDGATPDVPSADPAPSDPESPTTTTTPAEPVDIIGAEVGTVEEPIMLLPRPGDDRLWLAERPGRIRTATLDADGLLDIDDEPALDLTGDTIARGEQGLLGMAFSADGATLHVSYTNTDGDTRIDSFDIDHDIDRSSRRTIFELEQPHPNHNGGHLLVTPDGSLLLGLGDGGGFDDPENRSQDDDSLFGKLLHLDPGGGEPEVLARGLRNPWRFDADTDGSLWIADVGQFAWEEINHVSPDVFPGADFGWSGYEGTHLYLDEPDRVPDDWIPPVHEYDHEDGRCSITGGIVYRGTALPHLSGHFLFADLCEGRVRAIAMIDGEADVLDLGVDVEQPFSFGRDADGEPYVLSATGRIIALRPDP